MTNRELWQPPARPEWLGTFNAESEGMDIERLVPLEADELISTARQATGFSDFGSDEWREPFEVLLHSIREEAELHFFGRLMTRSDILTWLQALLGIEAAFNEHPEIADQKVDEPVFITGLPRSGTSILFELMSEDEQFGSPRHWELMFPYPPPERQSYHTDPRIDRCQHLVTQFNRVAPTYATMHEMDAQLPNECIIGQACSFISEYIPFLFQVPSYIDYLYTQGNWKYSYSTYKRMLQVLQFRNPRRHWLLKAPSHLNYLPTLFDVFPDARVVMTHRDPLYAQASVTDLAGTFFWMRSDKPMDVSAFEALLAPEQMAAQLDRVVGWIDSKAIPTARCSHSLYADLIAKPDRALRKVYDQLDLELSDRTLANMQSYLADKPQAKFGKHRYSVGDREAILLKRRHFARYQNYFSIPSES